MKIFTPKTAYWENKVNFVDDNNVLVGYDLSQCCCEHADWFIADEPTSHIRGNEDLPDLDGFQFDTEFFEEKAERHHDAGATAIFRMVNAAGEEKYLHLFNIHNGYYSHGFTMSVNGETIKNEVL